MRRSLLLNLFLRGGLAIFLTIARPSGAGAAQTAPASTDDAPDAIKEGRHLLREGHFSEAESFARKSLAEMEARHGSESIEAARMLDLLVEALCKGGKAADPESGRLSEKAVNLKKGMLGPEPAEVAVSLRNLAVCCTKTGDYARAESAFEEAVRLQEQSLGPAHLELAQTLNDFGIEERRAGNYAKAKELLQRALGIRETILGPDRPEVAASLNSLGVVLLQMGEFAEAKSELERALDTDIRALGPDHLSVSNDLNNLGILLDETGDYDGARRAYGRALRIKEKVLGPEHPDVGATVNNLGLVLMSLGDYAAARPLLERSLRIKKTALGSEHPDVARLGLNNLARLSRLTGDYVTGEQLYRRSLAIQEKALDPFHPQLAETLKGLVKVLKAIGQYSEAEAVCRRSIAIQERSLGAEHPDLAVDLADLAEVLARLGKSREALDAALRAEEIAREHVRLTAPTLSEDQALRYATVRARGLDVALSLLVADHPPARTPQVWDSLTRSRALVLDEIASRNRSLTDAGDPALARLVEERSSIRTRLAKLVVRGPSGSGSEAYVHLLEQTRLEKENAERALAEKSAVFRREQTRGRIGFEEIRKALPSQSALIAYVGFNQIPLPPAGDSGRGSDAGKKESPAYLAFLLTPGRSEPEVVFLGPAVPIDALVQKWRAEATTPPPPAPGAARRAELRYREVAGNLRRAVWDPIAERLGDLRQLFVVPDGALHLVNFATLPIGPQGYLVEKGASLHYLSAERDLVPSKPQGPLKNGLLAVGGPAYDATSMFAALTPAHLPSAGKNLEASTGYLSVPALSTGADATSVQVATAVPHPFRGAHSSCAGFRSMLFEPLPASSREVREIAAIWGEGADRRQERSPDEPAAPNRRERSRAVSLIGAQATEAAVKEMAGDFGVLHLATHGFFLGDCPSALGKGGDGPEAEAHPASGSSENPFLLAGLALAGANHRSSAGTDEEDGILTAEEIASLDLSGVDWVVLSACDTGLGRVQVGEGVFGLRRAFQTAGAKTLILSLWPLDDQAAREWMQGLYRGRLAGLSTVQAVRGASLQMVQARRRAGRSTHPFFWGTMVASGDWR